MAGESSAFPGEHTAIGPDLVVERPLLELIRNARNATSIQVVNRLKPGLLTRALAGEHVGTVISAS